MPFNGQQRVYSATYSNVPVYEFGVAGNHVMRRRADDWINATHILKVADFDKPARTRILEREVQKGVHEKVQGGYGKYQGTWVPLPEGRALADRNGVLGKLLPIFDFVPGDRSPPPAPKHATAVTTKPRASRAPAGQRRQAVQTPRPAPVPAAMPTRLPVQNYELSNARVPNDDDSQDVASVVSDSITEDQDGLVASQYSAVSRKRKRSADLDSIQDQQHQIWADSLLDYFMLLESDERFPAPPEPPPSVNLDRPIDDKGHSAMHWAASMGDVAVTRDLIARGARIDCLSNSLETPLMRAVLFTNNYDKDTMPKLITFLLPTVANADWFGSTVFHHIAATTSSRNKYFSARYYLDTIINKLTETWPHKDIQRLLDVQDQSGDTALMIAARNGARKCVRALLGRHVATDTVNRMGESADDLIREMNARRQDRRRNASSSPFQAQSVERANGFPSSYPNSATLIGTQTSAFSSETAAALKHKFMPAIAEKCDQLAAAYEVELEEKEVERGEAERVLRKRQLDCDATRKQIAELQEQTLGEPVDQTLDDEYNALIAENESLLELEQTVELGRLVAEEERKASETIQMQSPTTPQDQGRVQLTQDLTRAQNERRALVIEIVRSQGYAGDYERQAEYKRLITGALGVKENDVENMLPEILSELEDAQERDRFETSPM